MSDSAPLRRVTLFLTDEHLLFLDRRATRTGLTRSEILRTAVGVEMRLEFQMAQFERDRGQKAIAPT